MVTILSQDAWLNIKVDSLVQQAIDMAIAGPIFCHIPHSHWACYTNQTQVVKQFSQSIQKVVDSPLVETYWQQKAKFISRHLEDG